MYELIIVGGGPAGITAGIYAARKRLNTLLITKDFVGQVGKSPLVENYPGFDSIEGGKLIGRFRDHLEAQEIEIVKGEKVEKVEKEGVFSVKTDEGAYQSQAVIYAGGSTPRTLDIPGEGRYRGKGVSYCVTCDGPLFADKKVAMAGGGNSGFEAALELAEYCHDVTIVELQEVKADEILQERASKKDNINVVTQAKAVEIRGDKMVTGLIYQDVQTGEKKELPVEGIFVEIGYLPASEPVEKLVEINERGEIQVDLATGRTKVEGFFAAGDVTEVPYKQISIAVGQGAKAALSSYKYLKGTNG